MNSEFYKKLVDLYAGRELPSELEDQMEMAAFNDQGLSHDMSTLRKTVDLLHAEPAPDFSEVCYQRILMKMYARGVEVQTSTPESVHLQYQLPMQG